MADIVQLNGPDLAAMLCSKVCHDLISPGGGQLAMVLRCSVTQTRQKWQSLRRS